MRCASSWQDNDGNDEENVLTLADVFEALTHIRPVIAPLVITEAAIDSRQVISGGLFVAISGERVDGHSFITQAFQRGALAALIERDVEEPFTLVDTRPGAQMTLPARLNPPILIRVENTVAALQKIAAFWRQKLTLRVIGITGSVGKSTTKEAVAQVLSQRYHTLKSVANLNNEIGLPLNVLRLTPGHQYAVLEMGFYIPGEIAQLCEIARPQVGVMNNIGTVHAERAGSQETIAQGKGELVESLPSAPEGVAILNQDDALVRPMAARTRARIFTYGLDPSSDLWADDVMGMGLEGIRFRLHYGNEILHLRVPMIGRHSVHTALRAAAVGLVENLTWDEIVRGLQESQTQLRLVAVRTENGALLLDDTYNASPESTLAALTLLEELPARRIAVLGDMLELGPYEREGHEKVGARAAEVAETLVTLGIRAHIIAESARRAGMKRQNIYEYEDREALTAWLQQNILSGDSVLIKGSHGLHMERIVAAPEAAQ